MLLALCALSMAGPATAEPPARLEKLRDLPDHCENYTSRSDFGPRVEQLLASARIRFIDSFGHAAPLGVFRVVPDGLAHGIGLLEGDVILEAAGVTSHLAGPPLWFFCLVDSGHPFDMRVQRYAGRQITLTFPGLPED
ncbi:MAG: hypothetical protein OEM49_08850 [Myxococcales bacterium]|nr:hypothetical protein [Myxococcales bacterium]MDH5307268.1 hypothetical protein [Myxococcales bacterium]